MNGPSPHIGTLSEKTLHRQLKEMYARAEGGLTEQELDGYVVDVLGPGGIIEIQTGNFFSIKKKLGALLETRKLRLVHPLGAEKTILVYGPDGKTLLSSRRSPKRQHHAHAAAQLLYIADFLDHPNFEFESLLVTLEETRLDDGLGRSRKKKSLGDCRMVEIVDRKVYRSLEDYADLLPPGLPGEFTAKEAAALVPGRKKTAGQVCYLLKKLGLLEVAGKKGRAYLYRRRGWT